MTRFLFPALLLLVATPFLLAAPRPKTTPKPNPKEPELVALEAELQRFPTYEVCCYWVLAAHEQEKWLRQRASLFPWDARALQDCAGSIAAWREIWSRLANARCPALSLTFRQYELGRVREVIGEANYWQGFLWPPVAVNLLWRVD